MKINRHLGYALRSLSPLGFVILAVSNLVFCSFLLLRDNQNRFDSIDSTFNLCTNLIHQVQFSCSNEIVRVRRYADGLLAISSGHYVTTNGQSILNNAFSSSLSSTPPKPTISLPFNYFVAGGLGVELNGFIFRIGDNFGYGSIQEIYSETIITSEYRIVRSSRFNPVISDNVNPIKNDSEVL